MNRIANPPPLPDRPADGNKGTFGRVLVVGGNAGMIGAPALAGRAALRMGSGLVEVAVPAATLGFVLSITPELIGIGLGDGVPPELLDAADKADVVAIGPGLGQSAPADERVRELLGKDVTAVVDADGLNLIAKVGRWPDWFKAKAVLTPHPGEMKRLAKLIGRDAVPSDEPGRIDIAAAAAKAFGQVVVLKGSGTVVTDGGRVYVNPTGDSSLAKAGTGDILTGMVASLIGQGLDRFDAACCGTYLHGRAGQIAGEKLGRRCVLSEDVIDAVPQAVREYEERFGVR
jgi:ADP-dependent NAD(P)H-hydrate dehydratase